MQCFGCPLGPRCPSRCIGLALLLMLDGFMHESSIWYPFRGQVVLACFSCEAAGNMESETLVSNSGSFFTTGGIQTALDMLLLQAPGPWRVWGRTKSSPAWPGPTRPCRRPSRSLCGGPTQSSPASIGAQGLAACRWPWQFCLSVSFGGGLAESYVRRAWVPPHPQPILDGWGAC
jgi:hypothetical protein